MSDLHERLRRFWDEDARTYDRSPSHAASDPVEAAAWREILRRHLPEPPASVMDVGAGTGAISLLLAELGYRVTAVDLSPGMLARAAEKAAERGVELTTVAAPATTPPAGPFDAVVERHLLWTTPDPVAALSAWRKVVAPRRSRGAVRGDLQPQQPAMAGKGDGCRRPPPRAGRCRRSPCRVRRRTARRAAPRRRDFARAPDPGPHRRRLAIGPARAPARRRVGTPDGGAADARPAGGRAAIRARRQRPGRPPYAAAKNAVMISVQEQPA